MNALYKVLFWSLALLVLSGFTLLEGQEGDGVVVIDKRVYKRYRNGYLLNIAYPQINYIFEKESHEANVFLQGVTWHAVNEFIHRIEASGEFAPTEETLHQLSIGYHVYMKNANMLSIKFFRQMQVTADGKSKNAYMHTTVNYLLSEKGQISLESLFKPESPYAEKLSKYLHKHYGLEISAEELRKDAKFCMTKDNLVLSFAGQQYKQMENRDFMVPWENIWPLVNLEGPVVKARVLKK